MTEENMKTVDVERPDLTGLPGMLSEEVKAVLAGWYEKSVSGTAKCDSLRGDEAWLCNYTKRMVSDCSSLRRALVAFYPNALTPFEPWSPNTRMEGCTNPERFRFVSYAIGVPYPEQSLELTRFYRGLEDRIKAGDTPVNICAELNDIRVPWPVYREAKRELNGVQLVPELRLYPFNSSEDEYDKEFETNTFYQNPARCRWVHEHTNRAGVVLGGGLPAFYPCVQTKKAQLLYAYGMNDKRLRYEYPQADITLTDAYMQAAAEMAPRILSEATLENIIRPHTRQTNQSYYKNAKNPSWKLPAAVTTLGLLGTALALFLGGCL